MMFINSPYPFGFKTFKIYEKDYILHNQYYSTKNRTDYTHRFIYAFCGAIQPIFGDYSYYQYLILCLKKKKLIKF